MATVPRQLKFGAVTIEWSPLYKWPFAIAHTYLDDEDGKFIITQCAITYIIGDLRKTVWGAYRFDGASTPWYVRWIPGYAKIGWHLFADCIHDFSCQFPSEIPRPIGDGIFATLLLELAEHSRKQKRKRRCQAWAMARAVSLFTFLQAMRGVPVVGKRKGK